MTVLSTEDPVRVYQDFATVDLISHGRAEITVGRSAFTEPSGIFGADLRDYDALFSEKLSLLLQLRDNDHVTWSGEFRPPLEHARSRRGRSRSRCRSGSGSAAQPRAPNAQAGNGS